eukprot:CAMPEP_0117683990 /NCGR_PEP_ID=MMETSP0804-20121206/20789_1 /TAXON_ID=1074897 /ORGANISM="Tetraselmis astigmatica, Strain CCMP880" /LENGTH=369 /DNA_ID=CAMNT_0005494809 /DNA_START=391 /DNA_END=1501 /DNA_ORIENTATION=-
MVGTPSFGDLPREVQTIIFRKLRVPEQFLLTLVAGTAFPKAAGSPTPRASPVAWELAGSADDDSRGPGVHLDPFRPVKVTLKQQSYVERVSGHVPKSGLAAVVDGGAAGSASGTSKASFQAWAYAMEQETERLDIALRGRKPTVVTLVARVPLGLESWDVNHSSVGTTHQVPMSNVVVGIGARFVDGMSHLQAAGCKHLKWLVAADSLRSADFGSCPELRKLHSPGQTLRTLDVTNCRNLDPDCLLQICGVMGPRGSKLQHLYCSWMTQLPESLLETVVISSSSLATLSIRGIGTDKIVASVLRSCPHLVDLDTAFSPQLSGECWQEMLEILPTIQRFNIRGCRSISPLDYWGIVAVLRERSAHTQNQT